MSRATKIMDLSRKNLGSCNEFPLTKGQPTLLSSWVHDESGHELRGPGPLLVAWVDVFPFQTGLLYRVHVSFQWCNHISKSELPLFSTAANSFFFGCPPPKKKKTNRPDPFQVSFLLDGRTLACGSQKSLWTMISLK